MSEVYIGSAGARWIAQMVARIGTVAEAVADGGNSGDDALTAGGAYRANWASRFLTPKT